MQYDSTPEFAMTMDQSDPLAQYRKQFHIPEKDGRPVIYLCGNSLGLQPRDVLALFEQEIVKWQTMGVEGHFEGNRPWADYHLLGKQELSTLLGTSTDEVVLMNNLTTNLHVLLATFYRPAGKRKKILIEKGAFPSDHYAVTSFVRLLGLDPDKEVVVLDIPDDGYLPNEVITDTIRAIGNELALVLFPGVQYYTGQWFDTQSITEAAHAVGAFAGFDLAHAIGNVPMHLHDEGVDFATWCSYKYLNSGPGNVSGIYIHEKHAKNTSLPRLGGWWGQQPDKRFLMDNINRPAPSVDGWMLSNVNVLATSLHLASLSLFEQAGIHDLRAKSLLLTGYLEYLLKNNPIIAGQIRILTPSNPDERGCQLSLYLPRHGREVFDHLTEQEVILDWREPHVIRVAPAPMYNTFSEVYQFTKKLEKALSA